ncbi:hypothetical protein RsoM2USA_92 [Ralstonia phage RsoM2USA]|nr:hypothetical protein RsoM2USA_92 [Ralstonia phage RsoM2USA]
MWPFKRKITKMTEEELKRLEELEAKICPKNPNITEDQHKLAHARYVFEYVIEDHLFLIIEYLKRIDDPENLKKNQYFSSWDLEKIKEYAMGNAKNLEEYMNAQKDDQEPWECYDPNNHIQYFRESILNGYHCGDCTAVACSCETCHAEHLYKIPYTANWSKHEGSRLLGEYQALKKKQKEEQEMKS